MEKESRFHVKLNSIKVESTMNAEFNIFGDTLPQVFQDLEQVIAYVTGQPYVKQPPVSQAIPAIAPKVQPASNPVPPPPAQQVGICVKCGSSDLEWVKGTRKSNGRPFAAFKCQECEKWQPAVAQ